MKNKAISLPVNMLILLAIGVVVILVFMPLIQEEIRQGKALRPENIIRPSLRDGFKSWKENIEEIREKKANIKDPSWKEANQRQIWDAYMDTKVNFMGGKLNIWRVCQFGLQEKGEDFTFKHCWNYAVENYLDEKNPDQYKLVTVDCPGCGEDNQRTYVFNGKVDDYTRELENKLEQENPGTNYICKKTSDSETNRECYPEKLWKAK